MQHNMEHGLVQCTAFRLILINYHHEARLAEEQVSTPGLAVHGRLCISVTIRISEVFFAAYAFGADKSTYEVKHFEVVQERYVLCVRWLK